MFTLFIVLLLLSGALALYLGWRRGQKDGEIIAFKKTAYWVARAREGEDDAIRQRDNLSVKVDYLQHEADTWRRIAQDNNPDKTIEDLKKAKEDLERSRAEYQKSMMSLQMFYQPQQGYGQFGQGWSQAQWGPSLYGGPFPWWPWG
jgi:hypothetical protein